MPICGPVEVNIISFYLSIYLSMYLSMYIVNSLDDQETLL